MAQAVVKAQASGSETALRHAVVWDADALSGRRVAGALRRDGHHVHLVGSPERLDTCLTHDDPDLMVAAFRSDDDARSIGALRARFNGPLVCYSETAEAATRIRLLRDGVDDVAPSPLSLDELRLRVQAVARRGGRQDLLAQPDVAGLTIDSGTHRVRVRGDWVQLTSVEFALLTFLMRHPSVAFTRRELLRRVWGHEIGDTSTVSVHVRRLRRKLERDTGRPEMIRTVWGSGYFFEPSAT